jgi:PAS domain S-box-containing protein
VSKRDDDGAGRRFEVGRAGRNEAREGGPAQVDPTAILLQVLFYSLFAVSLFRYVRRPGPLELSVLAVFGAFVSLFLLTFINAIAPVLSPIFRPWLITMLFLQPYLVVRLADQIQPVPLAISRFVLVGAVASIAALLAAQGSPSAYIPAVGYFFTAEAIAGIRFAVAARRRFGLARFRLALAAVATALFGGAILIVGIGAAAAGGTGQTSSSITDASRITSIVAALGYVAAFVSPGWLRRFVYRALAFDLVRSLVAPPVGTDSGRLWEQLAATAREILGARSVAILVEPGGPPLATIGEPFAEPQPSFDAPADPNASPDRAPVSRIEVRVRAAGGPSEQLVAEIEGRPLFVEDDIALLQLLGSLTARAVDREGALIGLGEAKRAIEESAVLRASESRFRALLDADPNAVLALDDAGNVTWATRQAAEMFGTSAEDLVGAKLADLIVLPSDAAIATAAASTTDKTVYRAETTGRRADGTRFPAELARAQFELDGRPFQLAVVSDITWRHEADQIRERFLGVLSHELRTPVTSIYGGTQLLLGRGSRLDPATRAELLVSVAAESERLQRMVENLVAMARIERGAEYGGPRPVLVERIIKGLVERERALWPEVTIKMATSGPISMVAADEEYLAQIMRNLLSNAAKYGGPGSTVEVVLVDGREEVEVLVRDDGPGINPEDAEKLFNLYFRAAPQASAAPGAGIGLFVCHELVTTMGGRIWAKPRPEGGAEFGFSLPLYPDEPEPTVEDEPVRQATVEQRLPEPALAASGPEAATTAGLPTASADKEAATAT